MLTIRLQRTGKRNHSNFRVVLAEKESSVSKKITELLGSYNPHSKDLAIKNPERLNYWISQRVEVSPSAHNLLVQKGFLKADKVKAFKTPKKKPENQEATAAAAPQAAPAAEAAPATEVQAAAPAVENAQQTPETPAA